MIFLPNKFERLISALRCTVQNLVLKNGIRPRYLRMTMLINKAESLFSNEKQPTDLKEFSNAVLRTVHIKKLEEEKNFSFSVGDIGNCIINRKLYFSLLLLICRNSEKIKILNVNEKVVIKVDNSTNFRFEKEVKKLKGITFREIKSNTLIIILTPDKTDKKGLKIKKDWLEITNPLSVLNCYLQN